MDRRRRVRAGGTPAARVDRACRPPAPGRGRGRALPARDRAGLGGGSARAKGVDQARSELHWLRNLPEVEVPPTRSRRAHAACSSPRPGSASLQRPCSSSPRRTATRRGDVRAVARGVVPRAAGPSARRRQGAGGRARLPLRRGGGGPRRFRLSGGLALPVLDRDGGRLGTLAVFSRRVEREVTEEKLDGSRAWQGRSAPRCTAIPLRGAPPNRRPGRHWAPGPAHAPRSPRRRVRGARYAHPLSLLLLRATGGQESVRAADRLPGGVRARPRPPPRRRALRRRPSGVVARRRRAPRARAPPLARRRPDAAAFVELRFEDDAVSCSSAASPRSPVRKTLAAAAETCQGC